MTKSERKVEFLRETLGNIAEYDKKIREDVILFIYDNLTMLICASLAL